MDWIPTIKGFELEEWEWWNGSWEKCRNITIVGDSIGRANLPVTANLTGLIFANSTSEVIIVNASCKNDGNEIGQRQHMNGTDWVWTTFLANVTANSNTTYSVYYNNTAATQHYDMIDFYDAPNLSYNGTGYPNVTGSEWMKVNNPTYEGVEWRVTADVIDMEHPKLRIETMHGGSTGEDYTLFYGSGGTTVKTQGTICGVFRVVGQGDGSLYNNMISLEGFGATPLRQVAGFNTTAVIVSTGTLYVSVELAPASNTSYHELCVATGGTTSGEVYLDGAYVGNTTGENVGATYRNLFGDGASIGNGGTDSYWSFVWFNNTDYLPPLNTSIGPEETVCPLDDTYITENTKFEPANMFCNVADEGNLGVLIINASNIILDCNGMALNGTGLSGIGVYNHGFDNVTIKNCKVENYNYGILLNESSENNTLYNNTASSNYAGVLLLGSGTQNNNITNNIIHSNQEGIIISYSSKNTISNSNISDNTYEGIIIGYSPSSENTIKNSFIKSNGDGESYMDVHVDEGTSNFFINTTYDTEQVGTGNLTRQWYLKANVTNKTMSPMENAEVSVYDKFNNKELTSNTSSNGLTVWNAITQYIHNQSGVFNYTPQTIYASHPSFAITNSTTENITDNAIVHLILRNWEIIFNVTSGEDGSHELNNINISCNYTNFTQDGDTTNPYGPYEFLPGSWSCMFKHPTEDYFNTTKKFVVNDDKTIPVKMSKAGFSTYEEHKWLEALYNCIINKDCDIYDLLNATYELTSNIWDQFKQTDESVVLAENVTNRTVSNTSNLTIEYLIDVPVKEDYQFLPIRIFYWFMDENNETCYNQAKETNSAENPFCNPLVAQTIGEVNTQINFTVELRPSLPEGNCTIVRRIDIDPENVWINYGHEKIGTLEVIGGNNNPSIKLSMNEKPLTQETDVQQEIESEVETQKLDDKTTGMITAINNLSSLVFTLSVIILICLILVGLIVGLTTYKNSRKRTP